MDRNDLISRSELKKTIINICGNCSNIIREYKEGVPDGNCAIQHIMNMIDNAPTVKTYCYFCGQTEHGQCEERPQGKWIPVSERWPSFSGLYLVSIDDLVTVAHFTGACFINRKGLMIDVSAWQELPEPYKKGGADMRQNKEPDRQITIEEYMQSLKGEN